RARDPRGEQHDGRQQSLRLVRDRYRIDRSLVQEQLDERQLPGYRLDHTDGPDLRRAPTRRKIAMLRRLAFTLLAVLSTQADALPKRPAIRCPARARSPARPARPPSSRSRTRSSRATPSAWCPMAWGAQTQR